MPRAESGLLSFQDFVALRNTSRDKSIGKPKYSLLSVRVYLGLAAVRVVRQCEISRRGQSVSFHSKFNQ